MGPDELLNVLAAVAMIVGTPALLYWAWFHRRIVAPRFGDRVFAEVDEAEDALAAALGLKRPVMVRGATFDRSRLSGVLPQSARQVSVSFFSTPGLKRYARITVDVQSPVKVMLRGRRGIPLAAGDGARLKTAFTNNPDLESALTEAFRIHHVEEVLLWDRKLRADVEMKNLPLADFPRLLAALDRIARGFEPVAINVHVLGGERQALTDASGAARCSYCHEHVTGSEPDLIACASCGTVLHEACWSEHGRCPLLGCVGVKPERGPATRV
jgi:hypothetical protein